MWNGDVLCKLGDSVGDASLEKGSNRPLNYSDNAHGIPTFTQGQTIDTYRQYQAAPEAGQSHVHTLR